MDNLTHLNTGTVFKTVGAVLGGVVGLLFGDVNTMLGFLAGAMFADYLTGILAAGTKAELSSKVGYKAIRRKLAILVIVALAHGIDLALGTGGNLWRDLAAGFYIGNEILSVFENVGKMDVLVPSQLKDVINKFIDKESASK